MSATPYVLPSLPDQLSCHRRGRRGPDIFKRKSGPRIHSLLPSEFELAISCQNNQNENHNNNNNNNNNNNIHTKQFEGEPKELPSGGGTARTASGSYPVLLADAMSVARVDVDEELPSAVGAAQTPACTSPSRLPSAGTCPCRSGDEMSAAADDVHDIIMDDDGSGTLDESNGMIPDSQSKRAQDESTETRNVEPSRMKLRYSVFWV